MTRGGGWYDIEKVTPFEVVASFERIATLKLLLSDPRGISFDFDFEFDFELELEFEFK